MNLQPKPNASQVMSRYAARRAHSYVGNISERARVWLIDMERTLDSLPPQYAAVLLASALGYGEQDIARELELSVKQVSNRLQRARRGLEAKLGTAKEAA